MKRVAVRCIAWLGASFMELGEFEKRVCRVYKNVVENLMDGGGGEKSWGSAEVWVLFLKDAQVIDELGAKE